MDTKEYNRLSKQLAQIIVQAYGKSPRAYDDLEEQVICAFTFGCHRAFSVDMKVAEWESKLVMVQILMDVFGFDSEMAGNALEYLVDCLDPAFNEPMHIVLECGDKGYGLLSKMAWPLGILTALIILPIRLSKLGKEKVAE